VHPDASSQRSTSRQSVAPALAVCPVIPFCVVTTRLAVATDILRLQCASGCLGTSRGSLSTTSTTPRVRRPRQVARLVTRLVAPLVVDFFTYTVRPSASARRAARRRLLRLCCVSGCLGTSRGSLSTTATMPRVRVPRHITRLVVNYFAYVVRSGASARRAARRRPRAVSPLDFSSVGRTGSRRASGHCVSWRDYSWSRIAPALLHLCRTSGHTVSMLDFSSVGRTGSRRVPGHSNVRRDYPSRGRNGYTSPMLRVWVPRHVARLVVDYFDYATRQDASAHRAARHAARRAARR
jgi:hypothetical protein